MPALEFMKLESGTPDYLAQWPAMCICGAQRGPVVDTGIDKVGYGNRPQQAGRIYLCRLCVTRAGRALGLVKGDEMDRLQSAADELTQSAKEIADRQELLDRYKTKMGEDEAKIRTLQEYIDTLRGELDLRRMQANQMLATAKEMVAA